MKKQTLLIVLILSLYSSRGVCDLMLEVNGTPLYGPIITYSDSEKSSVWQADGNSNISNRNYYGNGQYDIKLFDSSGYSGAVPIGITYTLNVIPTVEMFLENSTDYGYGAAEPTEMKIKFENFDRGNVSFGYSVSASEAQHTFFQKNYSTSATFKEFLTVGETYSITTDFNTVLSAYVLNPTSNTYSRVSVDFYTTLTFDLDYKDPVQPIPAPPAILLNCIGIGFATWKLKKTKEF